MKRLRRGPRSLALAFSLFATSILGGRALSADAIDDYLKREMAARKIPGLAFAVAQNGEIVRTGALGLAHVETGSPVTADSVFAIASLDKQITAAGLLKAAELGKLSIDDAVSKWVEIGLPGATLKHLVSHLSGLPDDTLASLDGRYFTDYTTEQLLAHTRTLTPVAPPGTRFLYSDTGLFLAQLATEKAMGEPWWQFLRRELFAPSGMKSPVSMAPGLLLPNRVSAYTLDAEGKLLRDRRLDLDYGPLYCDLGMTVADFARFLAAQDRERPLSAASVATLTTPALLVDGTPATEAFQWSRYGLGVGLDEFVGEPITLHSGHSGVGFVRFPKRGLSIAVFTNLEHPAGSDPVGLAMGIAGRLEPALSLDQFPALSHFAPATTEAARSFYEAFLAGAPPLDRVEAELRIAVFEGASGLAGRTVRLGPLQSFEPISDPQIGTGRTVLYRARHAHGTIYWRVTLSLARKATRIVWWHI